MNEVFLKHKISTSQVNTSHSFCLAVSLYTRIFLPTIVRCTAFSFHHHQSIYLSQRNVPTLPTDLSSSSFSPKWISSLRLVSFQLGFKSLVAQICCITQDCQKMHLSEKKLIYRDGCVTGRQVNMSSSLYPLNTQSTLGHLQVIEPHNSNRIITVSVFSAHFHI